MCVGIQSPISKEASTVEDPYTLLSERLTWSLQVPSLPFLSKVDVGAAINVGNQVCLNSLMLLASSCHSIMIA
ncbi:hypothetical protein Syun_018503 [Stephania yunnanensis]|uniref:Uncharacterized protein n=1 Tax=Stephania yunnanensis TaxID=152371 RepID=A0AAP0IUP5_9MAGN